MAGTYNVTTETGAGAGSWTDAVTGANGDTGSTIDIQTSALVDTSAGALLNPTILTGAVQFLPNFGISNTVTINNSGLVTVAATISGAGDLIKAGSSELILSGSNSYDETSVTGGTLRVAGDGNLGSGKVSLSTGSTLKVTGAGTIDNTIGLSGSASYTSNVATTLSGVIDGSGGFTKLGAGTLTLSATNTYSGTTTVSEGKLIVSGSIGTATTVASGAILGGAGTVAAVTVSSGGTLAPGASPGILYTGNLTLASGSTLEIELGGTTAGQYDQVDVTGAVTLTGSTLSGAFSGGYAVGATTTFTIINNDGSDAVTGTFSGLAEGGTFTFGGTSFKISYVGGTGNDVTLTYTAAAPEPVDPNKPTGGSDTIKLADTGGSVQAGNGDDTVTGGAGDDTINGNIGFDSIAGGDGNDIVLGGLGNDFINGNKGSDFLFGDNGNDTVLGGQGHDNLMGGGGNDYLSGDAGDDVLTGGVGADIFNFRGGSGYDMVTDFNGAQGDRIWISASDAANFQALASKMSQVSTYTYIKFAGQEIILSGVQMSSLTADHFVFG